MGSHDGDTLTVAGVQESLLLEQRDGGWLSWRPEQRCQTAAGRRIHAGPFALTRVSDVQHGDVVCNRRNHDRACQAK